MIWATGIFEGEGCLTFKSKGNQWALTFEMTDEDVIIEVADILKIPSYGPYNFPSRKTKKPTWITTTGKRSKIYEIVCLMYPYLKARRREKCDEFLKWYADKTHQRYD